MVLIPVPGTVTRVLDPSPSVVLEVSPCVVVEVLSPSVVLVLLVVLVEAALGSPPFRRKKMTTLMVARTRPTATPTSTGLA